MTPTEKIMLGGLLINAVGSVWLWLNHRYSAKAERVELFERMREVEIDVARIMEHLGIKARAKR